MLLLYVVNTSLREKKKISKSHRVIQLL